MLMRSLMIAMVLPLTMLSWAGPWEVGDPQPTGKVIVVKAVDISPTEYRFEPAEVTANPGDTVRFEQTGTMPHNVEFRQVPAGTKLGGVKMGPFMTKPGETYDVAIDARFADGVHQYVCTPHEAFGMKGSITVSGR